MGCATGQDNARLSSFRLVTSQSESAVQTGGEEEEEEETTGREEVRRSHAVARREQSRVTKNMHGRANPTLD